MAQKRQFRVSRNEMNFQVAYIWVILQFLDGLGISKASPSAVFRRKNFRGEKIEKKAQKTSFSGFSNFRPRKLLSIIYLNGPSCSTCLVRPDAHFTFEIGRKNKSEIEKWRQKCPSSRFSDFPTKTHIFDP